MAKVIELCRRCGFSIPEGAESCPGCGHDDEVLSLAARQVAGLEPPTRSVHPLPALRSRRERPARAVGPARGARSAFAYTSLFVLIALVSAAASWTTRLDRFLLGLPEGLTEDIDGVTRAAAWASVIGLVVGLIALGTWGARRLHAARLRARAQPGPPPLR